MVAPLLLTPLMFSTSCFVLVGWWPRLVPHRLMFGILPAVFALAPAVLLTVFSMAGRCVVLVPLVAPSKLVAPALLLAPLELAAARWSSSKCVPL